MADTSTYKPTQTTPLCNRTQELGFFILHCCIGAVIFIGNVFTFVIFVSSRRLRQSYMNVFLLSLAVADIMMAVFGVPFAVVCIDFCTSSNYCWLMAGLKDIALGGTLFSLAAISVDRYLAVIRPLRYQRDMTKKRVTIILLAIWSLSCTVAFIPNSWLHTKTADEAWKIETIYYSILTFVFALLPIFAIIGMNVKIIQAIRKQIRRIREAKRSRPASEDTNQENMLERKRARRGTIACVLVVFIFLLSWLPLAFTNFSTVFGRPDLVTTTLNEVAWLLLFFQSSANPFIYSFFRSEFRQAAFKLICCKVTGSGAVAINPINENNPCETGCCKATGNRFRADSRRENEEFALQ